MGSHQARRDMVDGVHGALGHGLEDLLDLLLAGHVMTQQLDAELWRRFREKLERHRPPHSPAGPRGPGRV